MTKSAAPILGWVVLSDADRAVAERRLAANAAEGTRDELGFGVIHFAYADRFFPGTSVLQTRIRYVWFVCWAYQELADRSGPFSNAALREIETRTGKKLLLSLSSPSGSGIIGWTRFKAGAEPMTMPSRIYWNALRMWSVLRPREATGFPPGQQELHARWLDWNQHVPRRDELSYEASEPIFIDLPPAPAGWANKNTKLDFKLSPEEANLVKAGWKSPADGNGKQESLMSRLAQAGVLPKTMWDRSIAGLASDDDRAALVRARKAASLVCIGRAIYAAMIEDLKNKDVLNSAQSRMHLDWLEVLRTEHRERALSLKLDELRQDVANLYKDKDLFVLLGKIQHWADRGGSLENLKAPFLAREYSLKNGRAMLLPSAGKRREDWFANAPAEPLNYRWHVVSQFLRDLAA